MFLSYKREMIIGPADKWSEVISFVAVEPAVNLAARLTEKAT